MSVTNPNENPMEVSPSLNRDQAVEQPNDSARSLVTDNIRYLVLKRKDGDNFDKVNPFLIQKMLYGLFGDLKMVKKIKEGLLVETVSAKQSVAIQKQTKVLNWYVDVVPHRTMNVSRGVIFCQDLLNVSEEDILEELSAQNVIGVRRIKSRRDGVLKDTPNHILTFNSPVLPKRIKVAFYSLEVRLYVPSPLRCFNCQKFGHTSDKCSSPQVCVCGKSLHVGTTCEDPVVCVNCSGNHSARSRECPVFKTETAIQTLKAKENISYVEAKKRVQVTTPVAQISYAKVCSTSNNESLVKTLVPQLVAALKEYFPTKSPPKDVFPQPAGKVPSEKRKRFERTSSVLSSDSESVRRRSGSQTSATSESSRQKRPKGWPKGKPRKPPAEER